MDKPKASQKYCHLVKMPVARVEREAPKASVSYFRAELEKCLEKNLNMCMELDSLDRRCRDLIICNSFFAVVAVCLMVYLLATHH